VNYDEFLISRKNRSCQYKNRPYHLLQVDGVFGGFQDSKMAYDDRHKYLTGYQQNKKFPSADMWNKKSCA